MPLIKVTDLTYKRDLLGRILGYGTSSSSRLARTRR
jgi:hypothetical protein